MARKDLSHITCFNCDKKGHYATKYPELRKNSDAEDYAPEVTLERVPCIDTWFNSGKMNVGFDGQGGPDSHVGFNSQ